MMTIDEARVVLLDNGEETFDRYTAIYDGNPLDARGMSENPSHPQGFGICVEVTQEWVDECVDAGQQIKVADAPEGVQRCIANDLAFNDSAALQETN